jgi:methyl-accepting chemotaxis protein
VIVALSITRPIGRLVTAMGDLAGGNTALEVPGVDRGDEVGTMAKAVLVFRDTAIEQKRLQEQTLENERRTAADKAERERTEAEHKIEADKRAQAEREAATAKVMNEFDAAVGGIVQAAMGGDFNQRVPLDGKDGVIRNLAGAMNTMCETIGAVMDDMVRMMSALAEGDLTRRITAEYHGTFGTLRDSANTTAERLAETVAGIKSAAAEVSNAAAEISTSTTDLSQRTEEQAAGLEETSASMEEIAATVRKNAENAQQANTLTAGTRDVADKGGQVVANAVEAMSRIEDSSRKISDIIGVIDEIARQTNLLALNAAVEAARAGDAGRGFAVVASEVRSLAQRSSQAAKDIKDLITNSNMQVQEGVELVNRAGTSLAEIVESIKSVAQIVADIANASMEQSTGIEQVNKALTQMDEVTQQNSALVEENAATAKTLETQSAMMTDQVGFFRLEQGTAVIRIPVKPAASAPVERLAPSAAPAPAVVAQSKPAAKRGGTVGRMQSTLATALKQDPDWEEL